MKTWEMIKELTEHPEKKFRRVTYASTTIGISAKVLMHTTGQIFELTHDPDGPMGATGNLTAEWEEIKQSVSFIEAVKAYDSGKDIYCILDGKKYGFYSNLNNIYGRIFPASEHGFGITTKMILEGEWFIED